MVHAIYPGTFDPPTKGHRHIITSASKMFGKVTVAIARNPEKRHMFSIEERKLLLEALSRDCNNVSIQMIGNRLLPDFAHSIGASVIVRGIRNINDFAYEDIIQQSYTQINEGMQMVYIPPQRGLSHLSSSLVRSYVGYDNWERNVRPYLDPPVLTAFLGKNACSLTIHKVWLGLTETLNVDSETSASIFADITAKYSGLHRAHVSLYHLTEMLGDLERRYGLLPQHVQQGIAPHLDAVKLAVFFHDIIYTPGAKDNKEKSQAYVHAALSKMKVPAETAKVVSYLISITDYPNVSPITFWHKPLAVIMHDLDFGVFAEGKQRFFEYDDDVRFEHGQPGSAAFADDRVSFLKKLLDGKLFHSPLYTPDDEHQARKNITMLLSERYGTVF